MLTQRAETRLTTVQSSPWIHGRVADVVLGWCWLPIAVVLHQTRHSIDSTQAIMALVFALSFMHQPVTLALVYADPAQRGAHRRMYTWTPFVAAVAILIGLNVSLVLVALMAGLWNAEHTLMQRYGVLRIYGRKSGDNHGRIEKAMLITWLVTALLFLAAYIDLRRMVVRLGVDQTNYDGAAMLSRIHGVAMGLFWLGGATSLALAVVWVRAERGAANNSARRAKWIYAAATLGLLVAVMIDPLAGIGGYVGAHAIEYFAIVHSSLRRRADGAASPPIVVATRTPVRRTALYVAYFVLVGWFISATFTAWGGQVYKFAVLFFGAMHILYDGFVWKLRTPAVAASLGINQTTPAGA